MQTAHSFVKPKSETITSAHRCKHANNVCYAQLSSTPLSSARRASYYIFFLENCGLTLRHRHSAVYLTSIQHRHVRRAHIVVYVTLHTLHFVVALHSDLFISLDTHTCTHAHTRIQRRLRALFRFA